MSRFLLLALLLVTCALARASGPVAPEGWIGSHEPVLSNGQPCCIPADLNGTGLVGGAFVLIADGKREFGLFALAYTPPLQERWQLLEKHPISKLSTFRVAIEPPGLYPFGNIRACFAPAQCTRYFASSADGSFKRGTYARSR